MEKENSTTRKRKTAIIDVDIPECWNLQNMIVSTKNKEPKNYTGYDY
jgi:hypothetical protein